MNKSRLVFTLFFTVAFLLFSFTKNDSENHLPNDFVVVLDAGHGGHDPGNLGNGYLEKNIALNIVLQIGQHLEKNGVKVIYTRKDDTFVDLFKRGEIANEANADLFVSVHCDSHNSDANGAGTFVLGLHANEQNFEVAKKENSVIYLEDNYEEKYSEYDINSPESIIGLTIMQEEFLDQSIQLAKFMQENFTQRLKRKDRKVKQAGFIVLHQTFMPSVLVETGFLTNGQEGAYLNSKKGQEEMGVAIAKAILKYKNGVDSNTIEEPSVANIEREEPEEKTQNIENTNTSVQIPATEVKEEVMVPTVMNSPENLVEKEENQPTSEVRSDISFKIQLMASSKEVSLNSANFKGLNELSREPYKNLFRYLYGDTNSYLKAKMLKQVADSKGYTTSYIVAYKAGERIPLAEALKYVGEQ